MRELRNYGLAAVCASVLVAAGCGSDSDQPAPAVEPDPTPPPAVEPDPDPEPEPTPMGMIEGIDPTTGLLAALAAAAQMGDEDMEFTIQPGMSHTVGGVKFMCAAGEMMCEVDLMVNAMGGVDGEWEGGTVTAMFIDPAGNMNSANAMSVAGIMRNSLNGPAIAGRGAIPGTPPSAGNDGVWGPNSNNNNMVDDVSGRPPQPALPALPPGASSIATLNLRDGEMGIGAMDDSMVSVTDGLDPSGPGYGGQNPNALGYIHVGDPRANSYLLAATPGSTVTAAVDMDGMTDDIGSEMAGAVRLADWHHKVLHADWGDTRSPGRDAGNETFAVVYSDVGPSTSVPFWNVASRLATPFWNANATRQWFMPQPNDRRVAINPDNRQGVWDVPAAAVEFTVQAAQTAFTRLTVAQGNRLQGTYFGAPGTFECMRPTTGCTITRSTTDATNFTIPDMNGAATPSYSGGGPGGTPVGTWRFAPAAGAMVEVPDQDWLAFGFWMTAPDSPAGTHRLGVFYDGMDHYNYGVAVCPGGDTMMPGATGPVSGMDDICDNPTDPARLTGTATYMGSATGYYVNGEESGMFTADATLTARFAVPTNPHTLSGRIDNFRDSMGYYIDSDTRAHPNDPVGGGEGDWAVLLTRAAIQNDGLNALNGGLVTGGIGGSADGVPWVTGATATASDMAGQWAARFYGPDGARPVVAPTGVAGDFRAATSGGGKGVVGAFAATR